MGYLVLQSADNREFDIIDGQQRMTTLSLMMLAAISHLSDLAAPNDPADPQARRAELLRASYIGYLDPVSLVPRSKLTLNRHNETFYQDYLVPLQRLPQRGLNASEHLLRRAFSWFKEPIRERSGDDGTAVASFVDAAVDKLFFTVITVTDELNAFKVFETLNARGVRLSTTDLLKNYLFSVVARGGTHPSEIDALERRWEGIVGLLGSESLPEFLRVYWNSRNRLMRRTCSKPFAASSTTGPARSRWFANSTARRACTQPCATPTTVRGPPKNAPAWRSCRCSVCASPSLSCWRRSTDSRKRTEPASSVCCER